MTQSNYVLITILICALCTQVTRWLPFLLFGGKKEVPGLVRYLGTILPAAIMAVLVVYCLKGITPLAYPYGLPELISVGVVVGLHLWKGNTLASIALGTVCTCCWCRWYSDDALTMFCPYPANVLGVPCRRPPAV